MTREETLKLTPQLAKENERLTAAPQTSATPNDEQAIPEASPESVLTSSPFLHHREVSDAIRAVNLIASGRNPFSDEPFENLRPQQRDSVLQALCVIVSALAEAERMPAPAPSFNLRSVGSSDPSSKRPLQEYLDRIEREAIIEALVETNHNRTAAARLLGITFRALRYRMERLELEE